MNISVCPVYTLLGSPDTPDVPNVVIDTLRMTSVAATALANGCARVHVESSVEKATALAAQVGALLGGERQAVKIPGFDLSNSPLEYTKERVGGRPLIMTTTNGTNAIVAAAAAGSVMLGCLLNAGAVAEKIRGLDSMRFVLAGTNGRFSLEDAVTAGAIIERLGGENNAADDMALAALMLYRAARSDFHAVLQSIAHYRRLQSLGYQGDLDWCLQEDQLDCVPVLDADGWFYAR